MKFLILTLFLLVGCMGKPCANTAQTIWEPTVIAWCDHVVQHEGGNPSKANLAVNFQEADAAILSITTYFKDGSLDYTCTEKTNKVHLKGMFPDHMHNKMLKVVVLVAYKGRVFEVPIYCTVSVL